MPMPSPTASNAPTPAPTAEPTPSAAPEPVRIGAMQLGDQGRATGVNSHQWVSVVMDQPNSMVSVSGELLLPPDAGPQAMPPPELPCRDISDPNSPGFCFHEFDIPLQVASDDRIRGYRVFFGSGGPFVPLDYLFTADGGARELLAQQYVIELVNQQGLREIDPVVGKGAVFAALLGLAPSGSDLEQVPVFWTMLGATSTDRLPAAGFSQGPRPTGIDLDGRIAGAGITPALPVVWLPSGDGYALDELPALVGGGQGGALAIDGGVLVGWSTDAAGNSRAVVWTPAGAGFAVAPLPVPEGMTGCARATAIDGDRVAGECSDGSGATLGAAWRLDPAAAQAILDPLAGDGAAHPLAVSGDLVVGWSGSDTQSRPAAWRLPE